MRDAKTFYKYVEIKYCHKGRPLWYDKNDLHSLVNKVYTECIQKDPDCKNQFIINKINWGFLDLYRDRQREKQIIVSSSDGLQSFDDYESMHYEMDRASGRESYWPDFSEYQSAEIGYAMSKLNDSDKSLVQRFHFGGESLREIAKTESVTHCTIRLRLKRIYKQLKEII